MHVLTLSLFDELVLEIKSLDSLIVLLHVQHLRILVRLLSTTLPVIIYLPQNYQRVQYVTNFFPELTSLCLLLIDKLEDLKRVKSIEYLLDEVPLHMVIPKLRPYLDLPFLHLLVSYPHLSKILLLLIVQSFTDCVTVDPVLGS